MVASIGKMASPAQGVTYYERDGYYAKDDPPHKAASAWTGKGAEELDLSGPVDPATFKAVLEGKVPDGPQLGKRDREGNIHHRPGRDVTLSALKSVSLAALVGDDDRVVAAHDAAVKRTLGWIEKNAVETRALSAQITRRLRTDFEPIGLRVEQLTAAIEVDAFEEELLGDRHNPFHILVATPEKLSLVIRNKKVDRPLALVVMDEAHNLEAEGRGLRIELLLATVKRDCP